MRIIFMLFHSYSYGTCVRCKHLSQEALSLSHPGTTDAHRLNTGKPETRYFAVITR
jgi:hypothetical protein